MDKIQCMDIGYAAEYITCAAFLLYGHQAFVSVTSSGPDIILIPKGTNKHIDVEVKTYPGMFSYLKQPRKLLVQVSCRCSLISIRAYKARLFEHQEFDALTETRFIEIWPTNEQNRIAFNNLLEDLA